MAEHYAGEHYVRLHNVAGGLAGSAEPSSWAALARASSSGGAPSIDSPCTGPRRRIPRPAAITRQRDHEATATSQRSAPRPAGDAEPRARRHRCAVQRPAVRREPAHRHLRLLPCVYLLLTAGACARLHASGNPALQALAQRLSRPPHTRQQSRPLVDEVSGKALNLLGYVGVLLVLFGLTFAMVNVRDQELSTSVPVIFAERRVVMRFDQPVTTNLSYNAQGAPVGAFTVLAGGIASAPIASPWPCFAMLLLIKHLHELVADVQQPDAVASGVIVVAEV
jgi:hypothetical protein